MASLDPRNVRVQVRAKNKTEAIRQVATLLVESGYIEPGYADSMLAREKVANTYLGRGIAIPHGLPKDRELIRKTGISVTQVPEGVTWNPGETVYLVVGIAARSDEHIGILANLTHVLDDEPTIRKLAKTTNPADIVAALTGPQPSVRLGLTPSEAPPDLAAFVDLTIQNPSGLHARPATTFVGVAKGFESEVRVRHGERVANGKSLASLLKLGVEGGSVIRVMAEGPDEAAALQALKAAVESGLGEEEEAPYISLPPEANPFLGVRGIRLCLIRPDLFRPQLRAIFRASAHGPVKIMFPMVSTLEDLRAARSIAEDVRLEVGAAPVEIGIMVEVPSAVLMAAELAQEADFFSIGTNDLTQYTLAMDRLHPMLAKQADGLHPAVLRMVDRTVGAATTAGRWVGVCGGIAADPKGAAILVGLGVTELSVSIPSIAAVKAQLRGTSYEAAIDLAQRALACRTADEVRALPV